MTGALAGGANPVRMALVGGGAGSFIGPVHAMAARLDGKIALVAGAFSGDPDRSAAAGRAYAVADDRVYSDWRALIQAEAKRPDGAEFIAIATPNHLHQPIALAALDAGLHVVSDKPAAASLAEAIALEQAVRRSGRHYVLTYTYTGYPMLRRARHMIATGAIGAVRKIVVQYAQGWLSSAIERQGDKQAAWRVDPTRAGVGGCIGDIGVHAFHLAEYTSGQRVREFVADLSSLVAGRLLDDDCNILLRFEGGQPGVLVASQISTGERNDLRLKVHGEKASLSWSHEDCGSLHMLYPDGRTEILRTADKTITRSRLPLGHPEGFIEAFANIYSDFADLLRSGGNGPAYDLPGIADGVRSMRFIEQAVKASAARAGWTSLQPDDVGPPAES